MGILKHLCVAPVGDPDAWAYPEHLCVALFGLPWSPTAIQQVVSESLAKRNEELRSRLARALSIKSEGLGLGPVDKSERLVWLIFCGSDGS